MLLCKTDATPDNRPGANEASDRGRPEARHEASQAQPAALAGRADAPRPESSGCGCAVPAGEGFWGTPGIRAAGFAETPAGTKRAEPSPIAARGEAPDASLTTRPARRRRFRTGVTLAVGTAPPRRRHRAAEARLRARIRTLGPTVASAREAERRRLPAKAPAPRLIWEPGEGPGRHVESPSEQCRVPPAAGTRPARDRAPPLTLLPGRATLQGREAAWLHAARAGPAAPARQDQARRPSAQELGLRRRDPPAGRPCWVKSEMDQSRPPPAQPQTSLPSLRLPGKRLRRTGLALVVPCTARGVLECKKKKNRKPKKTTKTKTPFALNSSEGKGGRARRCRSAAAPSVVPAAAAPRIARRPVAPVLLPHPQPAQPELEGSENI